jgi:6-pyruvoyltetrahydropterin/6-carboxytetrahydropterin synthase
MEKIMKVFVDGRLANGRFSVSHRVSFAPYGLDRFHGHTYEVIVSVSGLRSKYGFIFPFEELSKIVQKICAKLNNKTILAAGGRNVVKDEGSRIYYITSDNKQYLLPKDDVVILNVEEVTAENLAEWIADQIIEELKTYTEFLQNIKGLELTLFEGRDRGIKLSISL